MRRGRNRTGKAWDVKGNDVPKGRFSRSLDMGLAGEGEAARNSIRAKRRRALDHLRLLARNADEKDRDAYWALIPRIGFAGWPTWDEVMTVRSEADFLELAHREIRFEENTPHDREHLGDRSCAKSVEEYLEFKEAFADETIATSKSVLRRFLKMPDKQGVKYSERTFSSLTREDARRILKLFSVAVRGKTKGQAVMQSTSDKARRVLTAWGNWELATERHAADDEHRRVRYDKNVFVESDAGFSKPRKDPNKTLDQKNKTRRFFVDEINKILLISDVQLKHAFVIAHRLGLRPGELQHLRYGLDVTRLPGNTGFRIVLEGGRGPDARCGCRQCKGKGWGPKNGPREYVLNRAYDEIGWITPAIEALETWLLLLNPNDGDFLFPSYGDRHAAWSNQDMNDRLRAVAHDAGVAVGLRSKGQRTFHSVRHSCGSEMLENGVSHPLVATWIGDTLEEFMKTYGRPDAAEMARVTLRGS